MMSQEHFWLAVDRERNLTAGLVMTTEVCREARRCHELHTTSCIALGRLLTASALVALIQRKTGGLSLQIVAEGRLGQLYADVTAGGDLRGYVKNPSFSLPVGDLPGVRQSVAVGVGDGSLSVIRLGEGREFNQSTTNLVTGEIDTDVEHHLTHSDQIPTILNCEVLLDGSGQVALAGGLILQAMPGAVSDSIEAVREHLAQVELCALLNQHHATPEALLREILPGADRIEQSVAVRWQCRCSVDKVLGALRMLEPTELAKMVDERETAEVSCDFCRRQYRVDPDEVERLFLETITARG